MPYIKKGMRSALNPRLAVVAQDEGQLNFQITSLLIEYIVEHGLSYGRIGDVEGALQNASKEFNRRVTAPYEDKAIIRNGDVYGPILELLDAPS